MSQTLLGPRRGWPARTSTSASRNGSGGTSWPSRPQLGDIQVPQLVACLPMGVTADGLERLSAGFVAFPPLPPGLLPGFFGAPGGGTGSGSTGSSSCSQPAPPSSASGCAARPGAAPGSALRGPPGARRASTQRKPNQSAHSLHIRHRRRVVQAHPAPKQTRRCLDRPEPYQLPIM